EEIRSREEILQAREDSLCRLADIFIGRVNIAKLNISMMLSQRFLFNSYFHRVDYLYQSYPSIFAVSS
ncbi:MAG: hypothetical protein N0E42_20340, partial [Candidatus Thiodiazotropha endolucinida]|nr:hypothetical protein [Candidatus Thiodiazotropha taylori]MCW4226808.1 hypothetical protein [Candidatus Thiodiazotropha endolucinida]